MSTIMHFIAQFSTIVCKIALEVQNYIQFSLFVHKYAKLSIIVLIRAHLCLISM